MIGFLQDVWFAAFPFLFVAVCVIALVAVHDGIAWWWSRGVTRLRQRLGGRP